VQDVQLAGGGVSAGGARGGGGGGGGEVEGGVGGGGHMSFVGADGLGSMQKISALQLTLQQLSALSQPQPVAPNRWLAAAYTSSLRPHALVAEGLIH
jgi:hypothetical protein